MQHTAWAQPAGVDFANTSTVRRSPDGYVWVGAEDGLLRFDGVRFVLLTGSTVPALTSTRAGRYNLLLVDRDGWLWIARPDGALVQYRDGTFRVALSPERGRRGTYAATQDGAGTLWFVGGGTLYTLRDGRARPRELPPAVPYQMVQGAIADTGNGLWLGTMSQGLWHVSGRDVEHFPVPGLPAASSVRPLLQSRDGSLWVASHDLMQLRRGAWSTPRIRNAAFRARVVVQTANGDVLFATRGSGLLRLAGGVFEQMTKSDGLFTSTLSDVMADADGTIWLTTDGGLERLRRAAFSTLGVGDSVPFETPETVVGDGASGIWSREDGGERRLFHGTGGVASRHAGAMHWKEDRSSHNQNPTRYEKAFGGGAFWADRGSDSASDPSWVARHHVAVRNIPTVPRGIHGHSSLVDREGTLWLSLIPRGFGRVRNGRFEPIRLPVNGAEPNVTYIAEDGQGHIWTTSGERPLICEFVNGVAATVLDSTRMRDASRNLVSEGGDTLWAFSDVTHRLTRIIGGSPTEVDVPSLLALPRASFAAVVASGGDLWIASPTAITRLQLALLHRFADGKGPPPMLHQYTTLDGVRVPHLTASNSDHSVYAAPDGRTWFATPGGLAVYDPALERISAIAPLPRIEEVLASGRAIAYGSPGVVPPNPSRVEIHYSAPNLVVPERTRIEYMLEGADSGWVDGSSSRVAAYTRLRDGHYRFRVRAWSEDGVPSLADAVMPIRVLPAWYQAVWFQLLLGLSVAAIGPLAVYALVQRRARLREEQLRARFDVTLAERTRMARELHDTLLQGFTGITLQLQAVRNAVVAAPDEARHALDRVLDLADATLDDARLSIWDMRMPELEQHDLSDAVEASARRIVADAPVQLRYRLDGTRRRLDPSVEATVLRVAREAVANAVKHGNPHTLQVDLRFERSRIVLRVLDDGSGFARGAADSATRTGHWGIHGMRERAERAGGDFEVTSTPGAGTTIHLSLPISGPPFIRPPEPGIQS